MSTSALGTSSSPHAGKNSNSNSAKSHYNPINPKLDLGNSWTKEQAKSVAAKLIATGLFKDNAVVVEKNKDSNTYHIDMQFKDNAYEIMTSKKNLA